MSRTRQSQFSSDLDANNPVRALSVRYNSGHVIKTHSHDWHQLVYATRGVMTVRTAEGSWVVPPQRAIWVPAGAEHAIDFFGVVHLQTLYFSPLIEAPLPAATCAVNVSPLLRELIVRAVELRMLDDRIPSDSRLIEVILDQLANLAAVPLQLPLPRDPRALRVVELLTREPGDRKSLEELASGAGAGKRTIERLFLAETGITFERWRQRMRLIHALRLLAAGEQVTSVALSSGYASTSAFISMFRRVLGVTPGRYFTSRSQGAGLAG